MTAPHVLESQQSLALAMAPAGGWALPARHALTLAPACPSVLEVTEGRVWLTVSGAGSTLQDHVLPCGARFTVEAGQYAVAEAWAAEGAAAFRWDVVPGATAAMAQTAATQAWERDVAQPWAELACTARRAVQAGAGACGASVRLVGGLVRWAGVRLLLTRVNPRTAH